MPAKTFKLNLRKLRIALAKAQQDADKAVKFGEKALAKARQRGDARAVRINEEAIKRARKTSKNLGSSINAVAASCCDQFLNCDPTFL